MVTRSPRRIVVAASRGKAGARGRRPQRLVTGGNVGRLTGVRRAGTFIKSRRVDTPKPKPIGKIGGRGVTSGRRRSKTPLPKGKGRFNRTGKVQSKFRRVDPPRISSVPEGQSSREDVFSVGIGLTLGSQTKSGSLTIDAPRGTKAKLKETFSPIDSFFVNVRGSGRQTREQFDNFFGSLI